jgi:hypothetical protein
MSWICGMKHRGRETMAKFMVYESAQTVYIYEVEAESQDKAKEIVEEGYTDPVRTEYLEREIYQIGEASDA